MRRRVERRDLLEAGRGDQRAGQVVAPRVVRAHHRAPGRRRPVGQQLVAAVPAGVRDRGDLAGRIAREHDRDVAHRGRHLGGAAVEHRLDPADAGPRRRRRGAAAPRPAPRPTCTPSRAASCPRRTAAGPGRAAPATPGQRVMSHLHRSQRIGSGDGPTHGRGPSRRDPAGDGRRGGQARLRAHPGGRRGGRPRHQHRRWSSTTSSPRTRCSSAAFAYAAERDLERLDKAASGKGSTTRRLARILTMYGPEETGAGWPLWIDAWSTALRSPEMAEVSRQLDVRWKDTVAAVITPGCRARGAHLRRPGSGGLAHHRDARRPRGAGHGARGRGQPPPGHDAGCAARRPPSSASTRRRCARSRVTPTSSPGGRPRRAPVGRPRRR